MLGCILLEADECLRLRAQGTGFAGLGVLLFRAQCSVRRGLNMYAGCWITGVFMHLKDEMNDKGRHSIIVWGPYFSVSFRPKGGLQGLYYKAR